MDDPSTPHSSYSSPSRSYALSGKVMLVSIVVLFAIVVLMLLLHIYARWHLLRRLRLTTRNAPPGPGLDPRLLSSLPTFTVPNETDPSLAECAVCLCEFAVGEKGRSLPACGHSFHVDCIDMWFHSHSTCPLCRCAVAPGGAVQGSKPDELAGSEPEAAEGVGARLGGIKRMLSVDLRIARGGGAGSSSSAVATGQLDLEKGGVEDVG